jgi:hypothetical protein
VKVILEEFRINKVKSNILKDVEELNRAKIQIRGWADSQLIYQTFVNQSRSKCGTDAQASDLRFEAYPY